MAKTAVVLPESNTTGSSINLAAGYTSITGTDMATKRRVFKAVSEAEPLKSHLGESITVVDVLSQPILDAKESGEVEEYTRVTLLADDGKAYAASSSGVVNSLETAFKVFGDPSQWEGGLAFIAREVQSPNNRAWRFITLELAE